ncbi:unnamed protein product [Urochloa humidicola]
MLWPERTRIAAEVRSALTFLHRNNTVHGHLNAANVLLLDLGMMAGSATATKITSCRSSPTPGSAGCWWISPARCCAARSASMAPYLDPEFLASSDLRPASYAYAFSVLLLRLLTGHRHPRPVRRGVARLALSCCDMASHNRPDLASETVANTLQCFL